MLRTATLPKDRYSRHPGFNLRFNRVGKPRVTVSYRLGVDDSKATRAWPRNDGSGKFKAYGAQISSVVNSGTHTKLMYQR